MIALDKSIEHYSFSSLSLVDTCAYAYYLEKIESKDKEVEEAESAFSQNGSLVHNLLDEWAKGTIPKDALAYEYELRYPEEVTCKWPKLFGNDLGASTYKKILYYFKNFDGFPNYEIVATEQEFETEINGKLFVGYIDMIAKEKDTGKMIIIDHKSKGYNSFKKVQNEMYRQQYLYSKYFYETYGKYPDKIGFNLFKDNMLVVKDFSMDEYDLAMMWATDQINKINQNDFLDWLETKPEPDFFCQYLCSQRFVCPMGNIK